MSRILFASDIDGTLLIKGKLPKENVKAIRKLQSCGHSFCVVTGRDIGMIPYEIASLCDYFVTINGAAVFDGNRKPIYLNPFSKDKYMEIHNIVYNSPTQKMWIHGADCFYEELRDGSKNSAPLSIYNNVVSLEELFTRDIYQISFDYDSNRMDIFQPIINKIRDIEDATIYVSKGGCDVMPSICSKAEGLRILNDAYHFDCVYAIGDGGNDLEMIQDFESFAIETGDPHIKENADHIVKSVAQAIESLHLY